MSRGGAAAAALLLLTGCAPSALGEPAASLRSVQLVRGAGMGPMSVGRFAADPALPRGADQLLPVRSSGLKPPSGATFSAYLGATLAAQLRAAGALDPASGTSVSGRLIENRLSAGIGTGHATVGAAFTVTRSGRTVFEKGFRVEARWPSNFIGTVAFMEAEGRYSGLYEELVSKLLADPAFQAAVGRAPGA